MDLGNRALTLLGSVCLLFASALFASASGSAAYDLYTASYLERSGPAAPPANARSGDVISIFASPGEYEPATFLLQTHEPIKKLSIEVSDLRCGKRTISRKSVVVRHAEAYDYSMGPDDIVTVNRYLPKLGEVDVPEGKTKLFWLTVHVPESAAPGMYEAAVVLKSEGAPFRTLKLRLEVLPIKLMAPDDMAFFMYHGPHMLPFYARNQQYMFKCFADMREHGMTTATLYMHPRKQSDGSIELNVERTQSCLPPLPTMTTLARSKLVKPGQPVIWIGDAEIGDFEKYDAMFEVVEKNKWPELLLYVVDEPFDEPRQKEAREKMAVINEYRKKHPERKIRTITAINKAGADAVGELYDIWIVFGSAVNEKMLAMARREGKEIWAYDCMLSSSDPLWSRHFFGFWAWRTGVKGVSHWVYAEVPSFYTRPYPRGQQEVMALQSFTRPRPSESEPSVGWEGVREGVDDYRYLNTLARTIEKAKSAGKLRQAEEAAKVLGDVEAKFQIDAYHKAYHGSYPRSPGVDQSVRRLPPQADIQPEDYNRLRRRVADAIVKLSKSLQ